MIRRFCKLVLVAAWLAVGLWFIAPQFIESDTFPIAQHPAPTQAELEAISETMIELNNLMHKRNGANGDR